MNSNNEVLENILKRRSCRSFLEKQISDKDLEDIVEAGLYAPSGRNTQDWHFTVLQDKNILLELNEAIKEVENRPSDYNCYYKAPTLILVSHKKNSNLAAADCACALQNIFLAATSLGVDSCWINQPGLNNNSERVRSIFDKIGVPQENDVYGCAALGYKTGELKTPIRKENTVNYVK